MIGFFTRYKVFIGAALLLALFIGLGSSIARKKSNTWDEPAHIMAGYAYLTEGMDYLSPLNHPVLGRSLSALFPALFLDLDFDRTIEPEGAKGSRFFPYSLKFLYENKINGQAVLFLSRLPNILLGALLGAFVFAWSRRLWGTAGGFLSLFFLVLSPNILAHSTLATTDLQATAFFFITAYYLYLTAAEGIDAKKTSLAAFFFAMGLASKHTTLLVTPFMLAAFLIAGRRAGLKKTLGYLALLIGLTYLFIWAVYGFSFHSSSPGYAPPDWTAFQPTGPARFLHFLNEWKLLPESYLYGLAGSVAGAGSGRAAFFMGQYSATGWASYFPMAFLIKTPIPTLIFLCAALLYFSREKERLMKAAFIILPPLLIFFAFSAQKVNIGLRHVLPAYPFIFVLIGFVPSIKTESMKLARAIFYACVVWYAYAAAMIFPHQLAYFNEFIGGPKNGYKYLVDSNLDWGQDLPGLKEFMDSSGIERIKLAYFGFSDPKYYGIDYEYLPGYYIPEPINMKEDIELKGWFAISATMLQGVYLPERDFYKPFREMKPVGHIGYSIFIYKL
ncbi:MAG: glycosyltransferase family 39 protein [Deltaproteobacteria bacterium]|nr:glycosyltransferase family 39 protein [Deltaproteobacteria bacterium]